MIPAHVVSIETPKKVLLNGLWFGNPKAKRAIIWVHGLLSSAFSGQRIIGELSDAETAVLTFSNRGHDGVASVSRLLPGGKKKYEWAGTAHEVFSDCVDDIQGAINFARKMGVKEIFLAGHSTGCQKSIYWAQARKGKGVKGIILLAPLSDYAGVRMQDAKKIRVAVVLARKLVKSRKPGELLPPKLWVSEPADAQRFLSLYTPDSIEQSIFPYFDEKRTPKLFRSIKLPILAIFAGADEYADRPAKDIAAWFEREAQAPLRTLTIDGATHGFKDREKAVAKAIRAWTR